MKRDLFICTTPLQIVIAKSIFLLNERVGPKPEFVLLTLSDSTRYRYYFDNFSKLCHKSEFVINLPKYPFYLYWIWRRFCSRKYKNIYFASINSTHIQYILSCCHFDEIRTFDDGTANITKLDAYRVDKPDLAEKAKRVLRRLTGNSFTITKICTETKVHYTLYPGFENISKKTKLIKLFFSQDFSSTKIVNKSNRVITIFLGTVYHEVIDCVSEKNLLIKQINNFLVNSKFENVIYIPHPRDEYDYFQNIQKYQGPLVAEEVILDLANYYDTVVVIGFGSSTQFNLMAQNGIENVCLTTFLLKDVFLELMSMLTLRGATPCSID